MFLHLHLWTAPGYYWKFCPLVYSSEWAAWRVLSILATCRCTHVYRLMLTVCILAPWLGSVVERITPLHFLAGCRKMWLNQALSVLSLSWGFFQMCLLTNNFNNICPCWLLVVTRTGAWITVAFCLYMHVVCFFFFQCERYYVLL